MADLDLPVIGGDPDTWGQKINNAITAVNNDLTTAVQPVDFYRRYVNGTWQVRGTGHPDMARIWVKHDPSIPNPPEDATYFKAGIDLLLMAT